jgi:hypothetical protein
VTVTIASLNLSATVEGGTPPWVVTFTVPSDATPNVYTVVSKCSYFDFPDTTVTVSAEATTTTSSTTSTSTSSTTSTTATPTTTEAVKAAAVNATASFTG